MPTLRNDVPLRRIVLLHGSCGATARTGWFPSVIEQCLTEGINIEAYNFPDPLRGRAKYWMPFLINHIKPDIYTMLVGHSSGALAALRYAENFTLHSSILIAVHHTDCGFEIEKRSGFFDTPFNWKCIMENQRRIIQFHSKDDPWVPIEEGRYIHKMLSSDYFEFDNMGHFTDFEDGAKAFPELVEKIVAFWRVDNSQRVN